MDKTFADVCRFFNLGEFAEATAVRGYANSNFLIETDRGGFFVKIVLEHPLAELEKEIAYLGHLASINFPAPAYLPGKDGSYTFRQGESIITATSKIEGQCHYELDKKMVASLGTVIAHLHTLDCNRLPARQSWWRPGFLEWAWSRQNPTLIPSGIGCWRIK